MQIWWNYHKFYPRMYKGHFQINVFNHSFKGKFRICLVFHICCKFDCAQNIIGVILGEFLPGASLDNEWSFPFVRHSTDGSYAMMEEDQEQEQEQEQEGPAAATMVAV